MNRIERNFTVVAASVLGLAIAIAPGTAQSGQLERKQDQDPQRQKAAERKAEQQRKAVALDSRLIPHDNLVGAAVVNNVRDGDEHESLGSISELVLDDATGRLHYAVLGSGGTLGVGKKETAIDWRSFTWDAENSRLTLAMSPEALERLPKFDPERLHLLDRSKITVEASGGDDGKPGTDADGLTGRSADAVKAVASDAHGAGKLVLASKLSGRDVLAKQVLGATKQEKIGTTDTLFIEPRSGSTLFCSVASGGVLGIGETDYVLPWAALQLVRPVGDEELRLQLGKTPKEIEKAPKLSDEGADVNDAAFRQRVFAFYGVELPVSESAKPAGKDGTSGVTPRKQDRDQ